MGVGVQHLAIGAGGEHQRIAPLPELHAEARLTAGQKSDLEQNRLDSLVIEPSPHLGHGGGQLGVPAPNLDNVH
ncbi:MAG TPA: hypothetical protein VFD87_19215 [Phototrophicaceae bacterium]|jgi:hypothetical protein|nr:hypothetical protein [Phototrophicaceae bacterium]